MTDKAETREESIRIWIFLCGVVLGSVITISAFGLPVAKVEYVKERPYGSAVR